MPVIRPEASTFKLRDASIGSPMAVSTTPVSAPEAAGAAAFGGPPGTNGAVGKFSPGRSASLSAFSFKTSSGTAMPLAI